jgi:hypothetical protein
LPRLAAPLSRDIAAVDFAHLKFVVWRWRRPRLVLHELRREGGRVCFLDHYHYGSSAGMRNQKAAKASAVNSWQDFVDLAYGTDWARFARAHSKSQKCERSDGGWSCLIEARPCK